MPGNKARQTRRQIYRQFLWRSASCTAAFLLTSQITHAISGGAPPDSPDARINPNTATSPFAGVGFLEGLRTDGSAAYGTATLIDPTHLLTAAHVVEGLSTANNNLRFTLNAGSQTFYYAGSYAISPDYNPNSNNDQGDLAIVTLSSPVLGVPTYSLDLSPVSAGTVVTFVGYGQPGDGVNGYYGGPGRDVKRVGQNTIDASLLPDGSIRTTYAPGDSTFLYDFDGPAGTTNFIGGPSLGNAVETTIGNGDSGAPAFVQLAGGQYAIVGVADFINGFQYVNGQLTATDTVSGKFGDGGGGAVLSAYSAFLTPFVAPEPCGVCAFGTGGLLLLTGVWRARRRV